eukprot:3756143-Prymnesium_polylepis.1
MRNGTNVAEAVSGGATRFNPSLVRVSQLVIMLMLACHWSGCLWWLVGTLDTNGRHPDGDTWGPDSWLQSQNLTTQYLHAFNWGAGMILAYVPNDVVPQEDGEVLVTTVTMFLGFFMGMIFISATTSALQSQDAKSALSHQKLEKINRYLEFKKVPVALSGKVLEYYQYQMTSSVSLAQMVEFKELPANLQTQLTMELNRNVLLRCSLWEMLPWDVVVALMAELSPKVFPPEYDVLKQGQPSPGLHFIEQGKVQVLQRRKTGNQRENDVTLTSKKKGDLHLIRTMGNSQFFGESSLLAVLRELINEQEGPVAEEPRSEADDGTATATVRTVGFCDMLVLTNVAFEQVLHQHENIREQIQDVEEVLARNK